MPRWIPERVWDNQDVFIIGGGKSLDGFDWKLLKNELTIGCNSAFRLGAEICKLCIFGDAKWFEVFQHDLRNYKGILFTNVYQLLKTKLNWIWTLPRKAYGLHKDALGWNDNTGSSAINLALLLGAKRIFLLGFDMHLSKDGKPNWHNHQIQKPNPDAYAKFLKGFVKVAADLKLKFPDVEVINITDNSNLNVFPKIGVKEFWEKRAL